MGLENQQTLSLRALRLLFRPLLRFCIRHALSIQDVLPVMKKAFVDVAHEELARIGPKTNLSRITAMTGIYRDEVARLLNVSDAEIEQPTNLLASVVHVWESDSRFLTKQGKPRILTYRGVGSEFYDVVESASKHLNPASVLFELERLGLVEKTLRGARLIRTITSVAKDPLRTYELLAEDTDTLFGAVEENLHQDDHVSNLHLRTDFDNIYLSDIIPIRRWLISEGKAFHKRAREYLSQFDKDLADDSKQDRPAGGKIVLTSYSLSTLPQRSDLIRYYPEKFLQDESDSDSEEIPPEKPSKPKQKRK